MDEDCGTYSGVEIRPLLQQDGKATIPMSERLAGRISVADVKNPKTGEPLLERNEEISVEKAKYIESLGITSVWVRSPLTCGLRHGICRACYGRDLATRKRVAIEMCIRDSPNPSASLSRSCRDWRWTSRSCTPTAASASSS